MPEVLVALYDSHDAADAVRAELVAAGFPTDRVELTSRMDEGRAGAVPGERFTERATKYFDTLFERSDSEPYAQFFTEGLLRGGAAVTVHPRGEVEVESATEVLQRHHPLEIEGRDLEQQRGVYLMQERAAGAPDRS
jgi:broad specificity phosphatase PhoE